MQKKKVKKPDTWEAGGRVIIIGFRVRKLNLQGPWQTLKETELVASFLCSILGPSVRAKAAASAAALLLKLFPALVLAPMFIIIQLPRHLIICVIKLDTNICKMPRPPPIKGQLKGKSDVIFIYS